MKFLNINSDPLQISAHKIKKLKGNTTAYLSREHKVGIHGYCCTVRNKVRNRFHDIP